MSVRTVVLDQVKLVAELHQKSLAPLTDTLPLLDSGLDSLCIANIMADLEDKLGFDPQTLGEFIDLYARADDRTTGAAEYAANHLGKISKCTARSLWDTGLNPTPPWRRVEVASDGAPPGC
jgi:hypothetical protein